MRLQNVTIVILAKTENNGLKVSRVIENPEVPSSNGKPVIGHYARRLLTVKEIAAKTGLSKGKAAAERRLNPQAYLADFEGQDPLIVPAEVKAA